MTSATIVPFDPANSSSISLAGTPLSKLWSAIPDQLPKLGATRTFYDNDQPLVLTSLGDKFSSLAVEDGKRREIIRKAVGTAVNTVLKDDSLRSIQEIKVDAKLDPHAAATAAHLAAYKFSLKTSPTNAKSFSFDPRTPASPSTFSNVTFSPLEPSKEWDRGVMYATCQNLARTLTELPANWMTPTRFTERVQTEFAGLDNVQILVHDEQWAQEKGMNTFLSVTHGTSEPAKFLEIHYKGSSDASPIALVGKGITFDSGGISLKPGADMKLMRGDMGGAAAVVAVALAVAKMKLPVNLIVATPLTENMPGPSATKPGDIVYAMNGKSVEVDNTDAEGRLVLSDALYYVSSTYKPKTLIDVATLTGAMGVALGEIYTGVFTENDQLWANLHSAGLVEHERFWRMPLDEDFGPQIYSSNADLCNTGGKPAGSCTAALFLKAFPTDVSNWAHIDIAGTMEATRPTPYQEKGMTGRPVCGLIEYIRSLATPSAAS